MAVSDRVNGEFDWKPCPLAARWVHQRVEQFLAECSFTATLANRMLSETGTRLIDWIDHFVVDKADPDVERFPELGFVCHERNSGSESWVHPAGLFPRVRVDSNGQTQMVIKVDSIPDFLKTHQIEAPILGTIGGPLTMACVVKHAGQSTWVIHRNGSGAMEPQDVSAELVTAASEHLRAFENRPRDYEDAVEGIADTKRLIENGIVDLGEDWACSLFFRAERAYWQSRNRAARIQKARQDRLGLGWANHDHHTYRSSRDCFAELINLLESMGFQCRERFYGGAEAGWGAQVLEQPNAGIVIFADVDLSAEEVTGDFAHHGLDPNPSLGTVGMWCRLHGEAILQAGMHHLECQFDFDQARRQLADQGIESMKPFTDLPYLKQAFTQGERWEVDPRRLLSAQQEGLLTAEQVARFKEDGSIGSHLEILQRDDGFKGFNQSGINEIIRATDPRRIRGGRA